MTKISIIVPVYNTETYLPNCLDSLVNQTFRDIEIIVVNDGSPDNSHEIIEQYAKRDNRIKVINQVNSGLSAARNTGIKHAEGEYITFLDSDDWIDLNTCEIAYNTAKKHAAQAVVWSYLSESSKGATPKKLFNKDEIIFDKKQVREVLFRRMIGLVGKELAHPEKIDSLVSAWGKLYKTEIIKKNKIEFIDLKKVTSEAMTFNFYYFANIDKAVFINKHLSHYRRNNTSSLTKYYRKDLYQIWEYTLHLLKDFIDKNCPEPIILEAYYNRVCFSLIPLGSTIFRKGNTQSNLEKVKYLKSILKKPRYREALKKLDFRYFPAHWFVFFGLARIRFATGFFLILKAMNFIMDKTRKS